MKTIYNKISNIINGMLEKVGYHFVGYKVDVIKLVDYMNQAKYNVKYNTDDIRDLKDTQQLILNDIQAIQLTIKSMREEYESLKTYHNNLSIDYRDNSASHTNLLKLKNELNARIDAEVKRVELYSEIKKSLLDTPFKDDEEVYDEKVNLGEALKDELTKPCKNNIDDNILMLVNIINAITEVKVNNACMLVQYGADIKLDKEPYQKYTMKEILEHYIKIDNNDNNDIKIASLERVNKQYERLLTSDNNYILEEIAKVLIAYKGDLIIDDFIDDVNDVFNGFNKIYNDVCDDANAKSPINEHIKLMKKANINLTNERGENNAK